MNFKQLLTAIFVTSSAITFAAEPTSTAVKIYGFVGNDFYYNSRQNLEMVDGVIHLFPKPKSISADGTDANATAQAEMLSVNTRVGLDITGTPVLGAKSSGKIEADFAGAGTNYFVLRIRQAYMKLNWTKSELTVGQTWHPFFSSVMPTTLSSNSGAPFQAFNRSPLVRFKQNLTPTLSASAAAIYEMQYASMGPSGTSNIYMKNSQIPNLFVGLENKAANWTAGVGADYKRLKPDAKNYINSLSATAYGLYSTGKFQLKGKAVLSQNLTDQLILGGYGVSQYAADKSTATDYTNFNNFTGWVNAVYGTKLQAGLILGMSHNLGTTQDLALSTANKVTAYGYGFYDQLVLDKLYRIAPQVSYNVSNFKMGVEYDCTAGRYGTMGINGKAKDTYSVVNNRVVATVMYIF
jgi:hypothetical protein